MKTIFEIPDTDIKKLDEISSERNVSRTQLVREAINQYLQNQVSSKKSFDTAFGLLKSEKLDALKFQKKVRGEWI